MKSRPRSAIRTATVVLAAAVLLLACPSMGLAGGKGNAGNPGVMPPHANAHGKTYGEWAAEWWQWALGIPAAENPLLEGPCDTNQSGPVWFLAGNFGWTSVRECSVPAGKALFFPLVNNVWVGFPDDPPLDVEAKREELAGWVDGAIISCEIDGIPVNNLDRYREESPIFPVFLPEGNLFGIDPGVYGPCLDVGYYLMLAPLSVGPHVIHFTASNPGWTLDVTYILTVGPCGPCDE